MLTIPGPHVILMLTIPGPHAILMLTIPGPHVTIVLLDEISRLKATLEGKSSELERYLLTYLTYLLDLQDEISRLKATLEGKSSELERAEVRGRRAVSIADSERDAMGVSK